MDIQKLNEWLKVSEFRLFMPISDSGLRSIAEIKGLSGSTVDVTSFVRSELLSDYLMHQVAHVFESNGKNGVYDKIKAERLKRLGLSLIDKDSVFKSYAPFSESLVKKIYDVIGVKYVMPGNTFLNDLTRSELRSVIDLIKAEQKLSASTSSLIKDIVNPVHIVGSIEWFKTLPGSGPQYEYLISLIDGGASLEDLQPYLNEVKIVPNMLKNILAYFKKKKFLKYARYLIMFLGVAIILREFLINKK